GDVPEQEQVHVDDARAVADLVEVAAEVLFDRLALVEQRLWPEVGLDLQCGVEEVRLLEYFALRLGLVEGRSGDNGYARTIVQRVARSAQVRGPIADVRAEAEVSAHRRSVEGANLDTSVDLGPY